MRDPIPPRSVVRWREELGRVFRVGYYSKTDGLDCVWLVNDAAEYEQTVDQKAIREQFEILSRSEETDFFGDDRPPLKRLNSQPD